MNTEDWWEAVYNGKEPVYDDEIAIDKRDFIDDDGVDISKKKSCDKTVEERIKTSRSLKIKYNKWNQVDFIDKNQNDKVIIDPDYTQHKSSFEDLEFENLYNEIIKNSKFKSILFEYEDEDSEYCNLTYQMVNEILVYTYGKLKNDYSLSKVFVMTCEYCGVNIQTMWKRISSYMQKKILEELSSYSKDAYEYINNNNSTKLF